MFEIERVFEPKTLDEAKELLRNNPNLKIVAGGTDIFIRIKHGNMENADLLSLRGINSMEEIRTLEDGTISIGAMASFSQIFNSEIINKNIPVLTEASVSMGGPQIRNVATIGGNICNGAVSADSASTLFALNAKLKLVSFSGERVVEIQNFYAGPGRVNIKPEEILEAILISSDNYNNFAGHYIKYSVRKAMDIAMLGVSVVCKINDGKFEDLRIALGVAAPVPLRCFEAEQHAKGKIISKETINEIGKLAVKSSKSRDSWRASKTYREHLIEILTQRALKEVVKRAGGGCIE